MFKEGKASAVKYVFRIGETTGLGVSWCQRLSTHDRREIDGSALTFATSAIGFADQVQVVRRVVSD